MKNICDIYEEYFDKTKHEMDLAITNSDVPRNALTLLNAMDLYKEKKIPETLEYNSQAGSIEDTSIIRQRIIPIVGFPLLSHEWIKPLAQWIGKRKVLEVMAGCGSLTYCLKQYDIDIIATDNFTWKSNKWECWTDIENIDCIDAIKKYNDRKIVICSWAYMDNTAYRILLELRKTNSLLIYIGEDKWGCTADDDFFDNMKVIDDPEFKKASDKYKHYVSLHDYLALIK